MVISRETGQEGTSLLLASKSWGIGVTGSPPSKSRGMEVYEEGGRYSSSDLVLFLLKMDEGGGIAAENE